MNLKYKIVFVFSVFTLNSVISINYSVNSVKADGSESPSSFFGSLPLVNVKNTSEYKIETYRNSTHAIA